MSYIRFGLMILTSTVVMFILMYLNTYAWEHVFFSETRTYMAIMMGATMAVIMLAYMLGMYSSKRLNIAIFVGAAVVFALTLWLVRSQVTVSGPSYMRAMIPHHSIAVMTSERAQIRDPRVAKLAHEIILAQRREIAEMRYLIAEVSAENTVESIYQDPPAEVGTVEDAIARALISTLDPSPMPEGEAEQILATGPRCVFNLSPESDPILWTAEKSGQAAMKLNGVLVPLEAGTETENGFGFTAQGVTVTVRPLGDESDWRADAELVFELDQGLSVGYRGFYKCEAR
ncbi:DUF305 domain-containing protein [Primorskyibacter flagellatus]|uniref:DUF305 domain-containing protein n=1 Tax=Primorskyibacter flagellatus TaxID=1387277 RepID=A0A1W2C3R4_9RHOB|nr:DUF305 domain-containing protein [Primorskyibacter flagellatus]SMC79829.1 protein of unknown function [Primorskyibacter flagellatus]